MQNTVLKKKPQNESGPCPAVADPSIPPVMTHHLSDMAECELLAPGTAEREEGGAWEQEEYWSVAEDFVIDNPFMHALWALYS